MLQNIIIWSRGCFCLYVFYLPIWTISANTLGQRMLQIIHKIIFTMVFIHNKNAGLCGCSALDEWTLLLY